MVTEGGFTELENLRAALSKRPLEFEPLTTIIAARCVSGVLLLSDTQETRFDGSKDWFNRKIFPLGKEEDFAIGCSGSSDDIGLFLRFLRLNFAKAKIEEMTNADRIAQALYDLLCEFYTDQISRSNKLGKQSDEKFTFDFNGIFVAPLSDDTQFAIYDISIYNKDGEPSLKDIRVNEVTAAKKVIGSGKEIGDALLSKIEVFLGKHNHSLSHVSWKLCAMVCQLIMGYVFNKDVLTGGYSNGLLLEKGRSRWILQSEFFEKDSHPVMQTMIQGMTEFEEIKSKGKHMLKDALILMVANPELLKMLKEFKSRLKLLDD